MNFNNSEVEVDSFGRTIIREQRIDDGYMNQRGYEEDNRRGGGRYSGGNDTQFSNKRGHDDDNNYHRRSYGSGGGGGGGGGGYRGRGYQDQRSDNRHSHNQPQVSNRSIKPLTSFKKFILTQPEDLPIESLKEKYDECVLNYIEEFSQWFYQDNKSQEWFLERYSPLKRHEIECETADWSIAQSEVFLTDIKTPDMLSQLSLEAEKESAMQSTGQHIPGHADRTIRVLGIHPACPKSVLKAAITDAIVKDDTVPPPERIVVSQPVWNSKFNKFERTAWVVMSSNEIAKKTLPLLREKKIIVPISPSITSESVETLPILHQFTIAVSSHEISRPNHITSSVADNESDLSLATELAGVLDEYRKVPSASNLATILALPDIAAASITNRLDVVIAYLRRVHLMCYYRETCYRDEAHLLNKCNYITFRKTSEESVAPVDGETAATTEANPSTAPATTTPAAMYTATTRSQSVRLLIDNFKSKIQTRISNGTDIADKDASELFDVQEKSYDKLLEELCPLEKEGKVRCCYLFCNKLFKGVSFLKKHMKTKHEYFNYDTQVQQSETHMKALYDAENVLHRPLPPVEVEGYGNQFELKSVSELLNRMKKDGEDGSSRGSRRTSYPAAAVTTFNGVDYVQPTDNNSRKMTSYMDVDAPKESVVSIDYGVAILPPTKKRRIVKK